MNGVQYVPTLAINIYNFNVVSAVSGSWTVTPSTFTPAGGISPGLVDTAGCAYIVVSDFTVTAANIVASPSYSAGTCTVTVNSGGSPTAYTGCLGSTATLAITAYDLTNGNIASEVGGSISCTYTATNAGAGLVPVTGLDVSYLVFSEVNTFTGAGAGLEMSATA
jgi:hypothetical protein